MDENISPQTQQQPAAQPAIEESPSRGWIKWVLFIIIAVIISSAATYFVFQSKSQNQTPKPVTQIAPSPTPTDATANWKTYTNNVFKYSLKYPSEMTIDEKDPLFVWIGKQVYVTVSNTNPETCRGDCPVIEGATDVVAGGLKARKISGYVGAVGGSTPQTYQTVVIPYNNSFYKFTLYELERDSIENPSRQLGTIASDKIVLFNQILSTFRFSFN